MAAALAAIADFSRNMKPPPSGGGAFTSVKDLQYDKHIYGDTYYVYKPNDLRIRA
jgi:hypothetical protein